MILWGSFLAGIIMCPECGAKIARSSGEVFCPKCNWRVTIHDVE